MSTLVSTAGAGLIRGLGAVVLCGGESSRMGRPKAWLPFGGEPLLVRVVGHIRAVAAPIVVVAAPGQDVPELPASIEVVRDEVSGRGPLQGMLAGLSALAGRADVAFVSSTDAPFLRPELVRRLEALRAESDHDVVVPRAQGHDHPLCAVYRVSMQAVIARVLTSGIRRTSAALDRARTRFVDEPELLADRMLCAADPRLWSLRNINTPEEYAAALRDASSG